VGDPIRVVFKEERMSDYRLSDLIDLTTLRKMADAHYRATGIPLGVIDAIDSSILVMAGWQDFCAKYNRASPVLSRRCEESDDYIKSHLVEGEACPYRCKNGLWDIGIPIVVAGRHLATLFMGQFFYEGEPRDREFFIRLAHEGGYDVDDYLAAVDRVHVFSHEKIDYIVEYNKGLAGFVADVAEHALIVGESERKFRAVFDQAYPLLWLLSVDGTLLEANRTAVIFGGVEDSDVIGRPFWETPWWTHSQELQNNIRLAVQRASNGDLVRFEATTPAVDGNPHYVDFSIKPVAGETGGVVLLMSEARDITERKRAETEKSDLQDQLALAQKMESIGRLAGGVAHDFNNMLGVIIGNAELALAKVDQAHPLLLNLEEIRKAAEYSADLTKQLLAFARKQTVAPRVLDLNETVQGMLAILQRLVGEDVDVAFVPGGDVWPVRIDPAQIDQILMNLTANARDSIAGVGKVSIETQNLSADEAYCAGHVGFQPGEYVVLAVSDDGCGMDRETLASVFEPFFTTKERGKGTGLGLATVYGIVRQNDGFINVYSEPGEGTTFRICLPRYAGKTTHVVAETPTESIAGGTETVLLVEDQAMVLRLARTILARLGYQVLAAATPGEAIRVAAEHAGEIHLLMTDVVMPEMNGRDLAKRLLSAHPSLRQLFTSGYPANVITHRGVLDEGVHFIQKPYSMKDLAAKLREVLDQQ
jgi:PAS domain S-box-containing protein